MASSTRVETVVLDRTVPTSGAVILQVLEKVGGVPIDEFDELMFHMKSSVTLAGAASVCDLYLWRPVVPNADPTVDAHWAVIAHLTQVTDGVAADSMLFLPYIPEGRVDYAASVTAARARGTVPAGGFAFPGHWGNKLRIQEAIGGTVTTQMVYSLHVTGIMRQGRR